MIDEIRVSRIENNVRDLKTGLRSGWLVVVLLIGALFIYWIGWGSPGLEHRCREKHGHRRDGHARACVRVAVPVGQMR